jgi:2-amino-4-hydroxy-6-hydroxymethyldihydropteridine diphosphokinase
MHKVFIGLGSNKGDRHEHLSDAVKHLEKNEHITVLSVSSFVDYPPENGNEDPHYLNGVIKIVTPLSPQELLSVTELTEKEMGRETKSDYTPRTIDLDILLYDQDIIIEKNLTIPHPLMHERQFVMRHIVELDAEVMHPMLEMNMEQLLKQLNEKKLTTA